MTAQTSNKTFVPHRRFVTVRAAEEWWIDQARKSPEAFIQYCLKLAPAIHHKMWLNMLFNPDNTLINLIAPRESAKTTITLYSMAWNIGKFSAKTNGIIAESAEPAKGRIADLRFLIEHTRAFKNVFPNIKIDERRPATSTRFSVVDTTVPYHAWVAYHIQSMKDPTVFGLGAGGAGMAGPRISGVLLLDDIVGENDLTIERQDKRHRYIINTLMPCLQEGGRIWSIGTRWMTDDIYERFLNNPYWRSLVIPAILEDDDGKKYSYWPEYWPMERLNKKRAEMDNDALFGIMYLCEAMDSTIGLFSVELFDSCVISLEKNKDKLTFKAMFVTTDFAISPNKKADWNVLYACGITYDDEIVVVDGLRYKLSAESNVDMMADFCFRVSDTYDMLTGIITEKVAFQTILSDMLVGKHAFLPVMPITPIGDKPRRATPVRDRMLVDKLWISDQLPFLKVMKAEYVSMGFARHDDTIDPLGLLLQHLSRNNVEAKYKEIANPFQI